MLREPHTVDRILCSQPPSDERGEDKFFWKPSKDGLFSINSAYNSLFASVQVAGDPMWRKIWQCNMPEKAKNFLWLFNHGRLHTALFRYQRGLADSPQCPQQCGGVENQTHMLRDCPEARDKWQSIIKPSLWNTFFSLQGSEWIKWNFKHEAGSEAIGKSLGQRYLAICVGIYG